VRIQSEADPKEILVELKKRGHVVALPFVDGGKQPLIFREFDADRSLVAGPYGTLMPPSTARSVVPDILIVPLLAFDRAGHRLGYGAGYYDRTLAGLRAQRAILAVGLAYAAQEVDSVLPEAHDQTLDWVVTEREAIRIRP
jgi:5-formyltetrahydrofolate cyclo-ligase